MKDFSKTHLTFLVLFLIVGLGGGYFWYWSVDNLEAKIRAKGAVTKKLAEVDKKGLPPTQAVLTKLQENQKAFHELSEKSLEELRQNIGQFDSVVLKQEPGKLPQGLPPDAWKKLMNDKRLELDKLSAKNRGQVAKDYYYGFSKFRISNPEEKFTGQLGIQLLGLTEISNILIESKVQTYISTKRVYVTEPKSSGGMAPAANDESLQASVVPGPDGLYEVYPFEVVFKCTTSQLRDVINRLNQSKYFFVIRFLMVENEKSNVKSKSAIQTELSAAATKAGLLMVPVAGNEYLMVRLRIDMLVWSKEALGVAAATEGKNPAPAARGAAR